jgi:hypothetical protein
MMWRGVVEGAPFLTGRTVAVAGTELAAFDQAYQATTLPDVAALNSRPSLTP